MQEITELETQRLIATARRAVNAAVYHKDGVYVIPEDDFYPLVETLGGYQQLSVVGQTDSDMAKEIAKKLLESDKEVGD